MPTDNTIHEILIRNMKRFREAKGWRKSDLARATGIDASHISNLENGLVNPEKGFINPENGL